MWYYKRYLISLHKNTHGILQEEKGRKRVNTKSEQLCNTYNMPDTAAKTLHMLIH